MFTGIVEEIGHVEAIDRHDTHARLTIACTTVPGDLAVGDSVAVDGCCLTATTVSPGGFTADLMAETLRATSLGDLAPDSPVNLERAMRADTRFGGHLVQGHVDAVGRVVGLEELPGTVFLAIETPAEVGRYLVPKGSVTVNGTSLTVVDHEDGVFRVGLIPHTLSVTTFGVRAVGDRVNLEADVVAKYVARLLVEPGASDNERISPYLDTDAAHDAARP
ncbi:MAG: riboflavin synthase [Nitriliruptoraceae bacterium]|nr:riboflavin synthase [Nitriliruptoraceae bacterium]